MNIYALKTIRSKYSARWLLGDMVVISFWCFITMIVYRLYWWSVNIDSGNVLVRKSISHYVVWSWLHPMTLCGVTRPMLQNFRASNDLINITMMTSSNGNIFGLLVLLWGESACNRSRRVSMFSLICAWTSGWANSQKAGDLIRHCIHYDVTAIIAAKSPRSTKHAMRIIKSYVYFRLGQRNRILLTLTSFQNNIRYCPWRLMGAIYCWHNECISTFCYHHYSVLSICNWKYRVN